MLNRLSQQFLHRAILKFYIANIASAFKFAVPIFILFYQARGLTFTQIGVLQSLYFGIVLLFETPTGYVGDRIGRKNSMLVGRAIETLFVLCHLFVESFVLFAVLYAFRGISRTFISGSDQAWLYDTLKEQLDPDQFARISGRSHFFRTGSQAIASVLGGLMYGINQFYPWVFGAGLGFIGIAVLYTMPEPSTTESEGTEEVLTVHRGLRILYQTFSARPLRLFVLYFSLLIAFIKSIEIFVQPFLTGVLSIPPGSIGLVYAAFATVGAIANALTGQIKEKIGIRGWFFAIPPLAGLGMAGVALAPELGLVMLFAFGSTREVSMTLGNQYINDRTASLGRATVLSGASMLRSLLYIPFKLAAGVIADVFPLEVGLGLIGAALFLESILILGWRHPVESPSKTMTGEGS